MICPASKIIGLSQADDFLMPAHRHHTSFLTTKANRQQRQNEGKWERIAREELPDEVK